MIGNVFEALGKPSACAGLCWVHHNTHVFAFGVLLKDFRTTQHVTSADSNMFSLECDIVYLTVTHFVAFILSRCEEGKCYFMRVCVAGCSFLASH